MRTVPFSVRTSRTPSMPAQRGEIERRAAPPAENSTRCSTPMDAISSRGVPSGDGFAVIHDGHAVAEPFGFVHVMGGQQNGAARQLELFDQLPELAAGLRVEAGGGLVEEQKIGIAHQRAGQRQPLFLPAGKAAHARFALLLELHQRDDFGRCRPVPEEAAEQADGFADGELLGKLGLLELNAQPLAQLGGMRVPAHAEHLDLARIGGGEALADFDGGGLAGAIGSQQAEAFARAHFQIEAVDGDHVFVRLAQIADRRAALGEASDICLVSRRSRVGSRTRTGTRDSDFRDLWLASTGARLRIGRYPSHRMSAASRRAEGAVERFAPSDIQH